MKNNKKRFGNRNVQARYRQSSQKYHEKNIKNIKIIECDAYCVLNYMIPDESIDEIRIYFPIPGLKKNILNVDYLI